MLCVGSFCPNQWDMYPLNHIQHLDIIHKSLPFSETINSVTHCKRSTYICLSSLLGVFGPLEGFRQKGQFLLFPPNDCLCPHPLIWYKDPKLFPWKPALLKRKSGLDFLNPGTMSSLFLIGVVCFPHLGFFLLGEVGQLPTKHFTFIKELTLDRFRHEEESELFPGIVGHLL